MIKKGEILAVGVIVADEVVEDNGVEQAG